MTITKLGHCCLLIELNGKRILTDPGFFTVDSHSNLTGIDCVLITHEHGDHFHIDSLKIILQNNPQAKVYTNASVGRLMGGLPFNLLEHNQNVNLDGVKLEGFGTEHAEIYDPTVPRVQNTGYMVGEKFFYPGDALFVPEKPVEILALPVAGPWIKTKEAIEYGLAVKPRVCFPVHDALLSFTAPFHLQPQKALSLSGITMLLPELNTPMEF